MGLTGLLHRKRDGLRMEYSAYGISGARKLQGTLGRESGFKDEGKEDVRLALPSEEEQDIYFQFKLADRGESLIIRAFDPNVPDKAVTEVKSHKPDLTTVAMDPNATSQDIYNAQRILNMMNKSKSGVKNSSLEKIVNELRKKGDGKKK